MAYALGVDLGSTFTAAGVFENGVARPVDLGDTRTEIPTAVHLGQGPDQWTVGVDALRAAESNPAMLATGFKRDVGRPQPLLFGSQSVAPTQLMAAMLDHVLSTVRAEQGSDAAHVTLTHPANWGLHRQGELRSVAEAAGLGTAGLLAEPDATAILHAAANLVTEGSIFAVYDLGGGTFDVSILQKLTDRFELVGPSQGIEELGGIDLDERLWTLVTDRVGSAWVASSDGSIEALRRALELDAAITAAREDLSTAESVEVAVPLPDTTATITISRAEFEDSIVGLIDQTVELVSRTCASTDVELDTLTAVLLTGGASRTPLISRRLVEQLGVRVLAERRPKHSVCLGAAITAAATGGVAAPPVLGAPSATPAAIEQAPVAVDFDRQGLRGTRDLALAEVPLGASVSMPVLRPVVLTTEPARVTVTTGHGPATSRVGIVAVIALIIALIVVLLVFVA